MRSIYHGWWVVLAGFVCTMMAIGSTTYSFGLFVAPLSTEFGLSRADSNTGFIFLLLGFALWAPLVGRALDRVSARAVVRDRPSDIGLQPDGAERAAQPATVAAVGGEAIWSFGQMLRSANFWLIACGAGILLGADQALLVSMIPYGTDAGLSLQQATLLVACCIIGLAIGGTYPLWMTLTADCFGSASFGVVMGSMNLLVMPFSIIAVRYIGEVFDRSGSYQQAFITFMATAVVSTLLILAVRLPRAVREQT